MFKIQDGLSFSAKWNAFLQPGNHGSPGKLGGRGHFPCWKEQEWFGSHLVGLVRYDLYHARIHCKLLAVLDFSVLLLVTRWVDSRAVDIFSRLLPLISPIYNQSPVIPLCDLGNCAWFFSFMKWWEWVGQSKKVPHPFLTTLTMFSTYSWI